MTTSTTKRKGSRRRGFTLVEVLVSAGLGAFVLAGVLTANRLIIRTGLRAVNYAEMESQCRRGLDQLGRDLSIATAITWNSASDITLTVPLTSGSSAQYTYAWTADTQSFFRVPGASSAATSGRITLIKGIPTASNGSAGVVFSRFDRDGNVATTDLTTKRVLVRLTATRTGTTLVSATQNGATATFVLRNKAVS